MNKLKQIITSLRPYLGFAVITLTVFFFFRYLRNNPQALQPVAHVNPLVVVLALGFYGGVLVTNFLITHLTIQIFEKKMDWIETLQLTLYSTIANFFGPLQSGPGLRAIYLKKRLGIKIKDYTLASLVYYFFFALFSFAMLLTPKFPWLWATIPVAVVAGAFITKKYFSNLKQSIKLFGLIGITTFAQLLIIWTLYSTELHVSGQVSSSQSLSFTGSANLALFVSLTPAAIGIRESFLYLSRGLHHIGPELILFASLLDRAIYFIFLVIIFITTSALHVRQKIAGSVQSSRS